MENYYNLDLQVSTIIRGILSLKFLQTRKTLEDQSFWVDRQITFGKLTELTKSREDLHRTQKAVIKESLCHYLSKV